jgi:DNA polymerase-3 subunit delta'
MAVSFAHPLPWHEAQWRQVRAWAESGRTPHAVLLAGAPGLGKEAFARRLAHALLCTSPGAPDTPCGTCASCRMMGQGAHPDYVELTPEEAGKPLRVDAIRELTAHLALRSAMGRRKVVLIHPAEAMNRSAANALLKTLEEPQGESVLLLVSHVPSRLPATVRSRCQRLSFRAPPHGVAKSWLVGHLSEPGDADRFLKLSGGAPLAALAVARSEALEGMGKVEEGVSALLASQADPVAVAESWGKLGAAEVCRWCWHLGADAVRAWASKSRAGDAALKPAGVRPKPGKAADIRVLFEIMDFCLDSRRTLDAGISLSQPLVLDTLASLWARAGGERADGARFPEERA